MHALMLINRDHPCHLRNIHRENENPRRSSLRAHGMYRQTTHLVVRGYCMSECIDSILLIVFPYSVVWTPQPCPHHLVSQRCCRLALTTLSITIMLPHRQRWYLWNENCQSRKIGEVSALRLFPPINVMLQRVIFASSSSPSLHISTCILQSYSLLHDYLTSTMVGVEDTSSGRQSRTWRGITVTGCCL